MMADSQLRVLDDDDVDVAEAGSGVHQGNGVRKVTNFIFSKLAPE